MARRDLDEEIRNRVIAALYSGHLQAGDRLPSVRELGSELDADPRAVLRAYRRLETEGLVEIRTRSGVYLTEQRCVAPETGWEISEWVAAEVLTGAWRRRIPLPRLSEFLERCVSSVTLRCACIDVVEDARIALCHELERDFGLVTTALPPSASPPGAGDEPDPAVVEADIIACTTFHVGPARRLAERLDKPLVVISADPVSLEAIASPRPEDPLLFVVVDPAFEVRLREVFGDETGVLLWRDVRNAPPRGPGVVYSRAAADRSGEAELKAHVPSVPVLSPETVRDLAHWIVRLNLEEPART